MATCRTIVLCQVDPLMTRMSSVCRSLLVNWKIGRDVGVREEKDPGWSRKTGGFGDAVRRTTTESCVF